MCRKKLEDCQFLDPMIVNQLSSSRRLYPRYTLGLVYLLLAVELTNISRNKNRNVIGASEMNKIQTKNKGEIDTPPTNGRMTYADIVRSGESKQNK